jgi:putative aminopeptidase FrvX
MSLPSIDTGYLLDFLSRLLQTPSPTGFTGRAISLTQSYLEAFPFLEINHTRKGALVADWPARSSSAPRALTAHVDTLGAMVKEIKSNGRLKLSKIGGFAWNTVEGEGCTVFTRQGEMVRGSLLLSKASGHVHGSQVADLKREDDNMEVRLDIPVSSHSETGSMVSRLAILWLSIPAWKSRTVSSARAIWMTKLVWPVCCAPSRLSDAGLAPVQDTCFHFSNYEEVGHGAAAGIPANVVELVSVDMAAVGEGQSSDEFHATLCVKDSGGPYHHGLSQRFRDLADEFGIPYKVDIYPYYGSDGEAFWRAGGDVALVLIGPGVDASHNYERTHMDALLATTQWIVAYLLRE